MKSENRRKDRATKHGEQEKKGTGTVWGSKELKCCRGIPLPLCAHPAVRAKAGAFDGRSEVSVIDEREIQIINMVRSMMG